MSFLKQMFCSHIWRGEKEEFLRAVKFSTWISGREIVFKVTNYYAFHETCIKCAKNKVTEYSNTIRR